VVVVIDQRIAIPAGKPDGASLQVKVRLPAGDFGRGCEHVVAHAQIQRQAAAQAPVILHEMPFSHERVPKKPI
jgi:hypothetical protein